MNLKDGLRFGFITFGVMLFLNLLGLPLTAGKSTLILFSFIVLLLTMLFLRNQSEKNSHFIKTLINGLIIGIITGVGLALITFLFTQLQKDGVRVNQIFAQVLPEHTAALTGLSKKDVLDGVNPMPGLFKLISFLVAAGLIGAAGTFLFQEDVRDRFSSSAVNKASHWIILSIPLAFYLFFLILRLPNVNLGGSDENILGLLLVFLFIGSSLFALRAANQGIEKIILAIMLVILVLVLPQLTDQFQNAVLGAVAIFVVMGLGLNVVVGYAGLLDLGYVAFFGIGAYTFGLLSAPESSIVLNLPAFGGVTFWIGLPIAILMGILAGVLLGVPVLRMRGDYLAIVTLGFGEIIRLLLLNLRDFTGGPGGVLDVPSPILFGYDFGNPKGILYLGLLFSVVVTIMTTRLRDSRLGRAWIALREDEDVAQAMGINLIAIKLLAFGTGAAFAAAAGTLYASRQVNIFPDNFTLLVSIDVLSLIIIGGMGSVEGVILGSIALIGLPEILRSVNEYRIIAFGALLVIMMILRPEGLLPSIRRKRELHSEAQILEATASTNGQED
jgi:branched-chain amino acid transport system permease protein